MRRPPFTLIRHHRKHTFVSIIHAPTQASTQDVIIIPQLDRLSWRDRIALRLSLWVIQRAIETGPTHLAAAIGNRNDVDRERRELAYLRLLPPR